ncbi:MAG: nicotinate-nucleotide--dimethylbenzimidazole phosphoribosyltransferase, partial [Acidobacteriota bacterium]
RMTQLPMVPDEQPPAPDAGHETDALVADPEKTAALQPAIHAALKKVYDPEIPVDIFELGLIYDVFVTADGVAGIRMTLTAPACPAAQILPGQVRDAAKSVEGVARKAQVIERALARHREVVDKRDAVGILAAVGGFEIATMAGFLLGAASVRLPVVVDGFISSSAALAAHAIDGKVLDFLVFSHLSSETAHQRLLTWLGVQPLLDLELRLGEGSGAALAMPVLDAAIALYSRMATFAEAGVAEE